jgi:hypothetical protein
MGPSEQTTLGSGAVTPGRITFYAVVLGLFLIALLGATTHVIAVSSEQESRSASSPDTRLAAARRAAAIEPWNPAFDARVVTLEAEGLLAAGKVDEAYRLIEPYSRTVRGDADFRRVYQAVIKAKIPLDSRKAHLQHAREQANGYLAPEDVFK